MDKVRLTSEQYAKQGGPCCPVCRSNNIQGDDFETGSDTVYQNIECLDCEAMWTDVYQLTGYSNLETR